MPRCYFLQFYDLHTKNFLNVACCKNAEITTVATTMPIQKQAKRGVRRANEREGLRSRKDGGWNYAVQGMVEVLTLDS